ncbi:MAG: AtpZ/AtpI family protein [bacterium]|nr:AtpZ/AtpI family protein [bacterium]MCY3888334.1 AtpZ/AtpI family protein [bacterium]MCY4133614.1 AtpZ/AtpI family protein [bacterium]
MPTAMTQNRQLYNRQSAGDALSIAFELVATPALFAFFGWLIDGALGTRPVFTLVLCLLTAVYAGWKAVKAYSDRMDAYDRELPSRRVDTELEATDG